MEDLSLPTGSSASSSRRRTRSFPRSFAGTWENDQLGKITLKGDMLETPDWKSKFARSREADGGDKIVLVDPPWVGFDAVVAKDGTLVLDLRQEKYVFKR